MTRVSRSILPKDKIEEISQHFLYLISSLTDSGEIGNFINEFYTKEEKLMLSKRLILFMMLQRKYPPHVIQSTLHISYETVRTYTSHFENKNELFKKTISRLIRREESKEFWKKIDALLKPLELAMRAQNNMKARSQFISGQWTDKH